MEAVQKVVQSTVDYLKPNSDQSHSSSTTTMPLPKANELRPNDSLLNAYLEDATTDAEKTVYTMSNGAPYPHPYESQRMVSADGHFVALASY